MNLVSKCINLYAVREHVYGHARREGEGYGYRTVEKWFKYLQCALDYTFT